MTTKTETVKETLDILEEANDVIEDTLDTIAAVKKQRDILGYSVVAFIAASAAAGFAVWYTKKRLKKQYSALAKEEIEEARAYYMRMAKPASPSKLAEQYVEEIRTAQRSRHPETELAKVHEITAEYRSDDEAVVEQENTEIVIQQNVFELADTDTEEFNYEEEIARRTEDEPYVISHDEFMACEKDYQQVQFTYYDGDNVLADERDQVVEDEDRIVGIANLLRFGHGSKDRNIVYIRNDTLDLEFEVVRSDGKYAEMVLGFIEHSERDGRPRKFRVHDE